MKFTLYARRCDPQFYIKNIQDQRLFFVQGDQSSVYPFRITFKLQSSSPVIMDHSSRTVGEHQHQLFQCEWQFFVSWILNGFWEGSDPSARMNFGFEPCCGRIPPAADWFRSSVEFSRFRHRLDWNREVSSRKRISLCTSPPCDVFLRIHSIEKRARIIGLIVCQVSSKQTIKRWDLPCCSFSERFGDAGMCESFPSAALLEHRPIRERHIRSISFGNDGKSTGHRRRVIDFRWQYSSTADHSRNR